MIDKSDLFGAGNEWRLLGRGALTEVWTDGQRVRRPLRPWSSAAHQLLARLEERNLRLVPRVCEITQVSEILTLLPGEAIKRPWPQAVQTSEWLVGVGHWLREFQEETCNFRLVGDAAFAWGPSSPGRQDVTVISHGDFGPWNLLHDGSELSGVIDWDLARFGLPIDDLTEAAIELGPLRANRQMLPADMATRSIINERLRALCRGFGRYTPEELITHAPRLLANRIAEVEERAKRGELPFTQLVKRGVVEELRTDLAHIRDAYSG